MGAESPSSNDVSLTQVAAATAAAPVGSPTQPQGNGAHSTNGKNGHGTNGNGHRKPGGVTLRERAIRKGWEKRFLVNLAKTGNVSLSAKMARVTKQTVYHLRDNDPKFAAKMQDALELDTALLENEARRRAHDGVIRATYYKGRPCGKHREFSDTLLIFLLKAKKPEVYRDNAPAVTVNTNVQQHTDVTKAFERIAEDNSRMATAFSERLTKRN